LLQYVIVVFAMKLFSVFGNRRVNHQRVINDVSIVYSSCVLNLIILICYCAYSLLYS